MSASRDDRQERDRARGADSGLTDEEREGMDLLGRESVRDGAIQGGSGLGDEVRAGPRRNPPQLDDVSNVSGDVSQSGGVAGGFRGHGGQSDAGAGEPGGESRAGPGEHRGTSRLDLDHPSSEIGGDRNDPRAGEMGPDR